MPASSDALGHGGAAPDAPAGLGCPLPALQQKGCIYLDYNATTPIWPEVSLILLCFKCSAA